MRLALLASTALLWANACAAQPVDPQTVTPVWFPHSFVASGGNPCSSDGTSGAPASTYVNWPAIISGGGYLATPSCNWADVNFAVGAIGLGTPVVTTGSTSTSSGTLTIGGGVPSYVAAGQTVVDLKPGQFDAIPATIQVASKTATTVVMTGNVASTVNSGDVLIFLNPIDTATLACGSKNAGTHQVTISTTNCTLTPATDFRGTGGVGWKVNVNSTGANISNEYFETLSSGLSLIQCNAGGSLTMYGNTLNGGGHTDTDTGALFYNGCSTWASSYDLFENAGTDNIDLVNNTSQTGTSSYDAFENNSTVGGHPDIVQAFNHGVNNETFTNPVLIMNETVAGTRGLNFGDYDYSDSLYTLSVVNPLILFTVPGANVAAAFGITTPANLAANWSISNPYIDPTGLTSPLSDGTFVSSGTPVSIGTATCSFSGTTMTCSAGAPVSGNFTVAAGLPPGTKINSGTGPFTLNNNVGTIGSESVGLWAGATNLTVAISGASGTTLTTTGSCANVDTTNGYVVGAGIPAGTHMVSDTCGSGAGTITVNQSVGSIGAETVAVWMGQNYATPGIISSTGGFNMKTGAGFTYP